MKNKSTEGTLSKQRKRGDNMISNYNSFKDFNDEKKHPIDRYFWFSSRSHARKQIAIK